MTGTETDKTVGRRIAIQRALRGWSQTDLADKLCTKQSEVSKWETKARVDGHRVVGISEASLKTVADVLGTSVRYLMTGEEPTIRQLLQPDIPRDYYEELSSATELWIAGLNLSRFFPHQVSVLQRVRAKGNVKVIVGDPAVESVARFGAAQELGDLSGRDRYKASVENSVQYLRDNKAPNLDFRLFSLPMTFGLDLIDPESTSGVLFVRFYPWQRSLRSMCKPKERFADVPYDKSPDQPVLKFSAANAEHAYWYDFYKRQFYTIWEMAKEPQP